MPQGSEDAIAPDVETLDSPVAMRAGSATRVLLPVACTLVVGMSFVFVDAALDFSGPVVIAVFGLLTVAVATLVGTLLLMLRRSRAVEAHLAERASFISTLLDTVDVAVVSCDKAGSIKHLNKRAQEYLGISEPTGLRPVDWANAYGMYAPGATESLTVEQQPIVQALRTGMVRNQKLEIRINGRVERVVVINGRALHDASGALTGAVVSGQDVTELERVQLSLNDEANRLRQTVARSEEQQEVYERLLTALSDVGEGVTIGEGDRFVYANQAFCDLTGFTEDELLAMASSSEMVLGTDHDRWSKLRSDIDAGKAVGITEALIRHKTGEPVAIEFSSKQVRVAGVVQRINVIRDVRLRRQWEDALAERAEVLLRANSELQQLQEVRADFLAAVSHDFRTPLTSIVGFTSLVIDQGDHATIGDARNYLKRIEAASDELRRRVDTFLDYSRAENADLELNCSPGDVARVVGEVLANLAPALAGRDVETRFSHRSFASIEERSLARVVENLITNAIKYSAPETPLKVEVVPLRGGIEVSVADRGYGIPAGELDLVFDSYFRSPEVKGNIRGSGIGLAVVRQLVEAMGGSVSAKNRDGGGTVFTVHLMSPHVSAL